MIDTRRTIAAGASLAGVGTFLSSLRQVFRQAAERRATRAALGRLDAHLLRDIGLTEGQAQREALKHFFTE
ncbi:MAG: DUF1127 domain-containing protein [Rhodobacteraceae bacterium]|nr:DUF1127 domain-containing protein [Paracoccaceae bacterium]